MRSEFYIFHCGKKLNGDKDTGDELFKNERDSTSLRTYTMEIYGLMKHRAS